MLFLQNYGGGLWNHTWSLAVEEHFYLFLPLLLVFSLKVGASGRNPFGWIPAAFVAIAVCCLGLRLYTAARITPFSHMVHLFPTHLRMDSLFCGVALSYFYHYRPDRFQQLSRRYRKYLLPVALLLFVPAFLFTIETTPFLTTYGLSLFWLGGGLLIFCCMSSEPAQSRIVDAASFIGSRSYSIYLWHMPVAAWGVSLLGKILGSYWNWYLYAVFYLAGSLLLGIFMSALIEYPVLRLRDRLCPSRSRPLQYAEAA
jgi:peptidoglycan/LPS O-acetylase OafA/YrhL